MLHVLVGSNDDDFDAMVDAARKGGAVLGWVVPKAAAERWEQEAQSQYRQTEIAL
jgi:hypothetical protein